MTSIGLPAEGRDYLRRLRWSLSALPAEDREDIAAELEGHIVERLGDGDTISEILGAFGSPERYARSFLEAHEEAVAISGRRLGLLMPALGRRSLRGGRSLAATITIALIWLAAVLIASAAVMKIFNPDQVGLWRSDTEFYLGFQDSPDAAEELLGVWIFPLAVAALCLARVASRFFALRILESEREF